MKCHLSPVFNLYQALEIKKKYFMKVIRLPGADGQGFTFLLFQRKSTLALIGLSAALPARKADVRAFIALLSPSFSLPSFSYLLQELHLILHHMSLHVSCLPRTDGMEHAQGN